MNCDTKISAAFRSPISGTITTGANHFEAFAASDIPSIDSIDENELLDNEGFWDGNQFLTRQETFEKFGFSCVEHYEEHCRLEDYQNGTDYTRPDYP